ncbi:MAG: sigma-70 family RNA polymerase sigma factor, partial [Opitutae bacterium]|nr:sigma-70 family RNA polymerase sigma factor [Opitutae bacterium]
MNQSPEPIELLYRETGPSLLAYFRCRPGLAGAAEDDVRLEPMREAIARLPGPQREALQLKLQHELSYEEIAEVLGVP